MNPLVARQVILARDLCASGRPDTKIKHEMSSQDQQDEALLSEWLTLGRATPEAQQRGQRPESDALSYWRLRAILRFCGLYRELCELKEALRCNQQRRLDRLHAIVLAPLATTDAPAALADDDTELETLEQQEEELVAQLDKVRVMEQSLRAHCETATGSQLAVAEFGRLARVRFMHRQRLHLRAEYVRRYGKEIAVQVDSSS